MRTVIDSVKGKALLVKFPLHPVMKNLHIILGIHTVGNTGLVGDQNQQITVFPDNFKRIMNTRNKFKILNSVNKSVIDIDNTVTIQKNCSSHL